MFRTLASRLQRLADLVAAGLLAAIFVAFIVQIALRYLFNWPVGWTTEVSLVAWLWLVLWGAAFVLKDQEEIRIDFISANVGARWRIGMGLVGSACMVVLFGMQLPAAYAYVTFMKVERSSYLNTGFDVIFSVFILFSVALIVRHLWNIGQLLRGRLPAEASPEQKSSAL